MNREIFDKGRGLDPTSGPTPTSTTAASEYEHLHDGKKTITTRATPHGVTPSQCSRPRRTGWAAANLGHRSKKDFA